MLPGRDTAESELIRISVAARERAGRSRRDRPAFVSRHALHAHCDRPCDRLFITRPATSLLAPPHSASPRIAERDSVSMASASHSPTVSVGPESGVRHTF